MIIVTEVAVSRAAESASHFPVQDVYSTNDDDDDKEDGDSILAEKQHPKRKVLGLVDDS